MATSESAKPRLSRQPGRIGPPPAEGRSGEEHWAWVRDHFLGWVYVICFGEPRTVRDGDLLATLLVSHYVGWTSQNPPMKRPMQHGRGLATRVVLLVPGTMRDEEHLKVAGTCVLCKGSLNYHREAYERHRATLSREDRGRLKRQAEHKAPRPSPW